MPPYAGFVGPSYVAPGQAADVEECINWYVEMQESEGAKSRYVLQPSPGMESFASTAFSPNRGIFTQNARTFAVIGFGFFEVNSDGTLTNWGSVDADTNPATISSSGGAGHQLFITSGGNGYIFDLDTNTLTLISGLDVTMGDYLDGYFLALDTVNHTVRISEYLDGLTWDPTQFRVRAVAGDDWEAMKVIHGEIWLFGSLTYEVWSNTGQAPFPFFPIPNVVFNQGIIAPFSMTKLGESLGWLGGNEQGLGMVFFGNQYAPERVSNHAVEADIQGFIREGTTVADGVSMTLQVNGNLFYVLTLPTAERTWAYNLSTKLWSKWAFWRTGPNAVAHFEAWRPMFHTVAFNKHLAGDRFSGVIYEMGPQFWSDADGDPIRRVRRTPITNADDRLIFYPGLEIQMNVGNGLPSGQGSNPIVMHRESTNAGKTWGNERHASSGEIGNYSARVRFHRLSASRNRVDEVVVSDPVSWSIVGATLFQPEVGDW